MEWRLLDLAVVVLQQIGAVAVQHAGPPAGQRGGVLAGVEPMAGRLDADDPHRRVVEEGMEQPHGVGAAADAGDQRIGQPALGLQHLRARLVADHRIGSRAPWPDRDAGRPPCRSGNRCLSTLATQSRSASFMASFRVAAPEVTGRTSAPSSFMRMTLGAWRLDVGRAHVDDAVQAEQGADGGGGDAVLAGPGLGDDALLAHALAPAGSGRCSC